MAVRKLLDAMVDLFPSSVRRDLYARILCGEVTVNGEKQLDPKAVVDDSAAIEIREKKYVSRGGIKLEKALFSWNLDCTDKVFVDAGSSTGGFTDCLLKRGASGVHAVDVGFNQLAFNLRKNKKVYVHEKTNIMDIENLYPAPDAGVADLSFRSIAGAASRIMQLVKEKWFVALVKPQFELDSREFPHFRGVIKDKKILYKIVSGTIDRLVMEGLCVEDILTSPIRGRRGNVEFLFLVTYGKGKKVEKLKQKLEGLVNSLELTTG